LIQKAAGIMMRVHFKLQNFFHSVNVLDLFFRNNIKNRLQNRCKAGMEAVFGGETL
jgi:hypothetical protein